MMILMQDLAVCGTKGGSGRSEQFPLGKWAENTWHLSSTIHLSSMFDPCHHPLIHHFWLYDSFIHHLSIIYPPFHAIRPETIHSTIHVIPHPDFPRQEAPAESLVDCTEAITREYELIYTAPWPSLGGQPGSFWLWEKN